MPADAFYNLRRPLTESLEPQELQFQVHAAAAELGGTL